MFHTLVRLGRSTLSGRGVFAKTDLPADTVVEVAPVLLLHRADGDHAGSLARYVFEWDDDRDETAYAMALGLGAMFNHSGNPSCRYLRADDDAVIARLVGDAAPATPDEDELAAGAGVRHVSPAWRLARSSRSTTAASATTRSRSRLRPPARRPITRST